MRVVFVSLLNASPRFVKRLRNCSKNWDWMKEVFKLYESDGKSFDPLMELTFAP